MYILLPVMVCSSQTNAAFPSNNTQLDRFYYFKLSRPERDSRMQAYGIPFVPRKHIVGFLLCDISEYDNIHPALHSIDTVYFSLRLVIMTPGNVSEMKGRLRYSSYVDVSFIHGDLDDCELWLEAQNNLLKLNMDILVILSGQNGSAPFFPQECDKRLQSSKVPTAPHTVLFAPNTGLPPPASFIWPFDWIFCTADASNDWIAATSHGTNGLTQTRVAVSSTDFRGAWSQYLHYLLTVGDVFETPLVVNVDELAIMTCWEYLMMFPADMYVRQSYGYVFMALLPTVTQRHD